jgi:hypothetical protein
MGILRWLSLLEFGFDIFSYSIFNDTTVTQLKGTLSKKTQVHYLVGLIFKWDMFTTCTLYSTIYLEQAE